MTNEERINAILEQNRKNQEHLANAIKAFDDFVATILGPDPDPTEDDHAKVIDRT